MSKRTVKIEFLYEIEDDELSDDDAKRLALDMCWERVMESTPEDLKENITLWKADVKYMHDGPNQILELPENWRDGN